jgi:AcrR family transcriptional regulator
MQPSTTSTDPQSTEEKLLAAAREVFSREGIAKATTREIAKVAGVNEVTLFRKFQTKQGLLAAVLVQAFLPISKTEIPPSVLTGATLREVVTFFAEADFRRKLRNIPLMRVLVAESHRLGELETEILRRIFMPWKEELANQLRAAKSLDLMREDADPTIIVDQLVAMIFVGALRTDSGKAACYSPPTYLAACVDTIIRAIEKTA